MTRFHPDGDPPVATDKKEFNYCFWAKLLVAIPALPLVAFIAASPFESEWMQMAAGAAAMIVVVLAAIRLDALPQLSGKIVRRNP